MTSQISTSPISTTIISTNPVVSSLPSIPASRPTFPFSQSPTQVMTNQLWTNHGDILVVNPNALPENPEKWLPKYNPDDALPAKEHLNNFMLAMNLNGVAHEDVLIRLFPYTFQGSTGSWYFSLLAGSIRDWDNFQEVFLAIW